MTNAKYFIMAGTLAGAIVSGLAAADESRERAPRRVHLMVEPTPELREQLRVLQAAGRPVVKSQPEVAWSPSIATTVRLDAIVDGRLHVSVAVAADQWPRMLGVTEVKSADDIADNTVFRGRLHTSYPLRDPDAERGLIPVVGEQVTLELQRGPQDVAFVVGWSRP